MNPQTSVVAKPPRRTLFRFSLRTLLLLVTLLCVALAWRLQRAKQQGEAVEVLLANGKTSVRYTHIEDGGGRHTIVPEAWERRLGVDFWHGVSSVRFLSYFNESNYQVSDADLAIIVTLPDVEHIVLHDASRVTSVGWKRLARLPKLKYLMIGSGKFSADEMRQILALPLEALELRDVQASEDAFSAVAANQTLKRLRLTEWLGSSNLTDSHFASFPDLPQLDYVVMGGHWVSLEALARLRPHLPALRVFEVDDSAFDKVGAVERLFPNCKVRFRETNRRDDSPMPQSAVDPADDPFK